MFAEVDPELNREDFASVQPAFSGAKAKLMDGRWIKTRTDQPIIVKGAQRVDVLLTYEHGADGILISNHSGRPLDTTRASLDVLFEIRKQIPLLIRPVFRGPAGANSVGVGREFLFAQNVARMQAVEHAMGRDLARQVAAGRQQAQGPSSRAGSN
ncbi:hypothetical protein EHS25_006966 [Saitozyma podzolica]|uniref:FMN-dependent dehydrogenase domain-containing protein n=1 Tax=Saitozyma podzolica TaxID=1890683 RepID=A0A427XPP3_9TREE|nr:hypothetical protein EHS25_006966 [Saitozyma podzolica]